MKTEIILCKMVISRFAKIKVWLYFFALLILIAGCQRNTGKREIVIYKKAIEQIKIDNKYQWIVVLPGLGCHGCIQEAEVFMKNNIDEERILFVLTKISSLKILQQKMDVRFDERKNIFVDREDLFAINTKNSIYPCVIQVQNGTMRSYWYQKPSYPALWNLEEQLKQ